MGKGRKPTPNKLKQLRGTDQPVRMNVDEVEYSRITKVSVPRILKTKRAKKIYRERSQVLINMQLLQEPDQDLLVAYANTLDLYYRAVEEMAEADLIIDVQTKAGKTKQVNPHLKLMAQLIEIINKLSSHFGFSPSSRASLKVNEPREKLSEFEKLMKGIS